MKLLDNHKETYIISIAIKYYDCLSHLGDISSTTLPRLPHDAAFSYTGRRLWSSVSFSRVVVVVVVVRAGPSSDSSLSFDLDSS